MYQARFCKQLFKGIIQVEFFKNSSKLQNPMVPSFQTYFFSFFFIFIKSLSNSLESGVRSPVFYKSSWGNTYSSSIKPLITLQKRAMRIITFSKPDEHSESLFKELEILKLGDLVSLHNALFCISIIRTFFSLPLITFFNLFHQFTSTKPGLRPDQLIILTLSKQTMVNSTFALLL